MFTITLATGRCVYTASLTDRPRMVTGFATSAAGYLIAKNPNADSWLSEADGRRLLDQGAIAPMYINPQHIVCIEDRT